MGKQLPKNWVGVSIKDVTKNVKGKKPKIQLEEEFKDSVPYIDIKALEHKVIRQYADIESSKLFEKGDVAMVWDGARSGWVSKTNFGAIGSTLVAFKPLIINSNYLYYYLLDKYPFINSNARGVGIPHVDPTVLWSLVFPLPPLAEQTRIVSKLDTLFAQLETIKASMAKVPMLLKDFRQQILTQAVTGKLTEKWREGKELESAEYLFDKIFKFKSEWAEKESLKGNKEAKRLLSKIKKVKSLHYPALPSNWGYFSLLDINHLVVDCHNKTAPYEESGIYLIRTTNIKKGEIVLKDIRYVSDETYLFWSKRCLPQSGDILFTREAPMGEAAIIPKDMKICLGQRTMLIRTPSKLLENKYVLYCLLSNNMSTQINEKAIGTGVKHLRVGDVENLLIPIPSLVEQQEIVSRVESLFAKADAIEQQYERLKATIETLPQAILHKAFKGELTEQLKSDGDARDLLKEIQKLKAATSKVVKKKVVKKPNNIK